MNTFCSMRNTVQNNIKATHVTIYKYVVGTYVINYQHDNNCK